MCPHDSIAVTVAGITQFHPQDYNADSGTSEVAYVDSSGSVALHSDAVFGIAVDCSVSRIGRIRVFTLCSCSPGLLCNFGCFDSNVYIRKNGPVQISLSAKTAGHHLDVGALAKASGQHLVLWRTHKRVYVLCGRLLCSGALAQSLKHTTFWWSPDTTSGTDMGKVPLADVKDLAFGWEGQMSTFW
jgi:hypothetical protein